MPVDLMRIGPSPEDMPGWVKSFLPTLNDSVWVEVRDPEGRLGQKFFTCEELTRSGMPNQILEEAARGLAVAMGWHDNEEEGDAR